MDDLLISFIQLAYIPKVVLKKRRVFLSFRFNIRVGKGKVSTKVASIRMNARNRFH